MSHACRVSGRICDDEAVGEPDSVEAAVPEGAVVVVESKSRPHAAKAIKLKMAKRRITRRRSIALRINFSQASLNDKEMAGMRL